MENLRGKIYRIVIFLKPPEALEENYMAYLGGRAVMKFTKNSIHVRQLPIEKIYSESTDIYSYGMVLFEMFSGKLPFDEMNDDEVN